MITIEVIGARPLAERMQQFPRELSMMVEANFVTLGHEVAYLMRTAMEPKRYKGQMSGSIQPIVHGGAEPKLIVGPEAPHALYVRFGTAPHWAPIEPLKQWAYWKLGDPNAAYRVRAKIAAVGTEPYDFLQMTMQDGRFKTAMVATAQRLGVSLVGYIAGGRT